MPEEPVTSQTDLASAVKAFVGRQAIFDAKEQIYAYELLFRSGFDNVFSGIDGDQATSSVISNSFFDLGLNRITGGKKAAINFTRNTLLGNYAQLLPKEELIVEILEDVEPEPEVLQAVRDLKDHGYIIALDDYTGENLNSPFFEFVDIIKVDIMDLPPERFSTLPEKLKTLNASLLAEKVETREEYQAALEMGYTLFQGYFFCKPTIITGRRIPDNKMNQIQLLREVQLPEFDFDKVEKIIKNEVSLSYKLLRYINSVKFGLSQKVGSIRQSFVLLGPKKLKKWISIATLTTLGCDKPPELLVTALVRARFCELLSGLFDLEDRADELFLLGMFSTVDALLDMPMEMVLQEIGLAPELKAALLGEPGPLASILNVAIGYEAGNWELFEESKKGRDLDEKAIPPLHLEAVKAAEEFLRVF